MIVIGMPRSGTSLTMAIFARKGFYVGPVERDRYREGDEHNPFGYFEADELVKRDAQLLRRAGFPHHNTWLFDRAPRDLGERVAGLEVEDADRSILDRYAHHQPWAWKDPRLTYTAGYWLPLVDRATTAAILCRRDPASVVNSFRRMGWPVMDDLAERVVEHADTAAAALARNGVPHTTIDYGDYLADPGGVATRLSDLVDLPIGVSDLNVQPSLDHAHAPPPRGEWLRSIGRGLPVGVRRAVRRVAPRSFLQLLLPELRHVARDPDERRRRGLPGAGDRD